MDTDPSVLEAAVARNVFAAPEPALGARRLAAYMREAAARLERHDAGTLEAKFEFPDPAVVKAPTAAEH
jgi:Ubiquinol-cytochrome C chaperone